MAGEDVMVSCRAHAGANAAVVRAVSLHHCPWAPHVKHAELGQARGGAVVAE